MIHSFPSLKAKFSIRERQGGQLKGKWPNITTCGEKWLLEKRIWGSKDPQQGTAGANHYQYEHNPIPSSQPPRLVARICSLAQFFTVTLLALTIWRLQGNRAAVSRDHSAYSHFSVYLSLRHCERVSPCADHFAFLKPKCSLHLHFPQAAHS